MNLNLLVFLKYYKNLLKIHVKFLDKELKFNLNELEIKWHNLTLERIFIENRIYHKIEELDNWDDIIGTIHKSLLPFQNLLKRDVNDEDVERLTEIKIKKITKYDLNKVNDELNKLELKVKDTKQNIDNLTEFAINYF